MSYSRWVTSSWYSFYSTTSDEDIKEQQILSLWHITKHLDFSYNEVKLIDTIKLKELFTEATNDDIIEALQYIQQFIKDVDNDFQEDDLR